MRLGAACHSGTHLFRQRKFTEHLRCARNFVGAGDAVVDKTGSFCLQRASILVTLSGCYVEDRLLRRRRKAKRLVREPVRTKGEMMVACTREESVKRNWTQAIFCTFIG